MAEPVPSDRPNPPSPTTPPAGAPEPAIHADGLVKIYGDHRALDGFDLTVAPGTVCGLLGPNGAGKTTAVRILTTLLRADGGSARVAAADVGTEAELVRHRIGLSGQEPAVDEILSGRQNLVLFGRLNGLTRTAARRRADELLDQLGLTDAADKAVKRYSGGMRRRLDLGVTLILAPTVLFLDEPTTGLDPRNRNEVWSAIRAFVAAGTTVLLTTQYLDEADQLADEIVVMEAGRVIARGTPDELKQLVGGDRLEVVLEVAADDDPNGYDDEPTGADPELDRASAIVEAASTGSLEVEPASRTISAAVANRAQALTAVVQELATAGITVADIGLRRPTLDDVFLTLTGHRAEPPPDTDPDSPVDPHDPDRATPSFPRAGGPDEHAVRTANAGGGCLMAAITVPPSDTSALDPSIIRLRRSGPPTGIARMHRAVRDAWLIAGRDMAQWVREPQMILWGLVMPIMFVVLFAYVLGSAMVVPGGGSYQAFVMPGMFVQTMAFGIGETLASVQADSSKGVMDRFRSMPMAPSAVVVGRCIANLIYSVVSLAVMVLAGLAVGWRWEGTAAQAFAAFGLLLLLRMAFLWIGIFLGLKATSAEMANSIYGLLYPVTMLSNAFVATALLPVWLGVIAEWNPLSSTVTATRELFGNPTGEPTSRVSEHALQLAILWPLVITAVTLPLAVRAYQKLSR